MKDKRVLCSVVDLSEEYDLGQLLLDGIFKTIIHYPHKDIEMSHVTEKGDIILGMFVTTQKKDLAPIHTSGDEDDYSAIPLKQGQGLAYPNVFLYHKTKKILLWEINKMGVMESAMVDFFSATMHKGGYADFSISLLPLMFPDAYIRINNLVKIKEVEFQIAKPTAYLRTQSENGTLAHIAKIANDFSASKAIKITVKADEIKPVEKTSVLSLLGFINTAPLEPGRVKNKIVVKGIKEEDGTFIEETINFMADRLVEYFKLEVLSVAPNLQVEDRKNGIEEVYNKLRTTLEILVG